MHCRIDFQDELSVLRVILNFIVKSLWELKLKVIFCYQVSKITFPLSFYFSMPKYQLLKTSETVWRCQSVQSTANKHRSPLTIYTYLCPLESEGLSSLSGLRDAGIAQTLLGLSAEG